MKECPTLCPEFRKYVDSLRTIACPDARGYIDQLATDPAFASGVSMYTEGNGVYSNSRGSPSKVINSIMKEEVPRGDKAKMLLGYTLRRIAETGECGLSDTMLKAAEKTGMFQDEIEIGLLKKIRRHSSEIGHILRD